MFTPLEIQPRLSFLAHLRRSRLTALVNLLNIFNFKSLTGFINLTNKILPGFSGPTIVGPIEVVLRGIEMIISVSQNFTKEKEALSLNLFIFYHFFYLLSKQKNKPMKAYLSKKSKTGTGGTML